MIKVENVKKRSIVSFKGLPANKIATSIADIILENKNHNTRGLFPAGEKWLGRYAQQIILCVSS